MDLTELIVAALVVDLVLMAVVLAWALVGLRGLSQVRHVKRWKIKRSKNGYTTRTWVEHKA